MTGDIPLYKISLKLNLKNLTLIRIQYILPTCRLSIIFLNNLRRHSLFKRQLLGRLNRKRRINLISHTFIQL